MTAESPPTYAQVLRAIGSWPRKQRLALMRHLFETIDDDWEEKERRRREALHRLEGMLATDAPPPTDEEVERILEEERMKKYG